MTITSFAVIVRGKVPTSISGCGEIGTSDKLPLEVQSTGGCLQRDGPEHAHEP